MDALKGPMDWKRYNLGDSCICWQLGDTMEKTLSDRVIFAYRHIKSRMIAVKGDVLDVVPSYNTIAVYFDCATTDSDGLTVQIENLLADLPDDVETTRATIHTFRVRYDGPDLKQVARHCGLTIAQVIQMHSAGAYHVAMIGFKPHYPYLIGLDPRLTTPRRAAPRTVVPAGSVAIGGAQTGVYPCESPGGWNIIGHMDPKRLKSLKPGDTIYFKSIHHQGNQKEK